MIQNQVHETVETVDCGKLVTCGNNLLISHGMGPSSLINVSDY